MTARAYALYGMQPTPYQIDQEVRGDLPNPVRHANHSQSINAWIQGWRLANAGEEKSQWIDEFTRTAEKALSSPVLTPEEFSALLFELTSPARLFPHPCLSGEMDTSIPTPETLPCPSLSPPASPDSSSGTSIADSIHEALFSSPASPPQPQPKKRGRKPGSKDREKRAQRGALAHLSQAEKSRRSRASAKLHKLQDQQQ